MTGSTRSGPVDTLVAGMVPSDGGVMKVEGATAIRAATGNGTTNGDTTGNVTGAVSGGDTALLAFAQRTRREFSRLLMEHQFAVDEVGTKVSILQREFLHLHSYNPIEHVASRVKSAESIFEKLLRKGFPPTIASARENLTDIGGVRIICSFIKDTYRVMDALTRQNDLRIVMVKDYIAHPKPNGYKSLHLLVEVPVFLSDGPLPLTVEVQIRTIAMDFWASLEHKIYYKYGGDVPPHLVASLTEAADVAEQLDVRMEQLHSQVHGPTESVTGEDATDHSGGMLDETILRRMWALAQNEATEGGPGATS